MATTISDIDVRLEPRLRAILGPALPLIYSGDHSAQDIGAFVRSASATRRWFDRRVVVQDDVNALAFAGASARQAFTPLLMPRGAENRRRFDARSGNKAAKLDLEAALVLPDGRFVAFGSGSTPARERLLVVRWPGQPTLVDAPELYAALRARTEFAGCQLNLEGALIAHGVLKLVQRGNGPLGGVHPPLNAIGDLPLAEFLHWLDGGGPVPELAHIARFDLGTSEGVRLSFTDAALMADGNIACLACAEDSPDAVADGAVYGSYFGLLDATGLALAPVLEQSGVPSRLKLEGLEPHGADPNVFDVVADVDSPDVPALGALLEVQRS